MKNLLNSLAGRLLCAGVMLAMVVSLFTGGAQVLVVGWLASWGDLLANFVGVGLGLWVARWCWR
jgi:VanZ family protein